MEKNRNANYNDFELGKLTKIKTVATGRILYILPTLLLNDKLQFEEYDNKFNLVNEGLNYMYHQEDDFNNWLFLEKLDIPKRFNILYKQKSRSYYGE